MSNQKLSLDFTNLSFKKKFLNEGKNLDLEKLLETLEKLLQILFEIQFCDLVLRICSFRFLGNKIYGRQILENDWNLPYFLKTFENAEHLKLFGKGITFSKETLKNNIFKQAESMKNLFFNFEKTLFFIFLDNELNFLKFTISVQENSGILDFLKDIDKEKFLEILSKKIFCNKDISNNILEKYCFIEISFLSSKKNKGKNLVSRIMEILEKNNEFYEILLEILKDSMKKNLFFYATYHPDNIASEKTLKKSGFEDVSNEIFNIAKYNTENNPMQGDRKFVIKKIENPFKIESFEFFQTYNNFKKVQYNEESFSI